MLNTRLLNDGVISPLLRLLTISETSLEGEFSTTVDLVGEFLFSISLEGEL